jgi:ubiquitin C-terminal hydrolase
MEINMFDFTKQGVKMSEELKLERKKSSQTQLKSLKALKLTKNMSLEDMTKQLSLEIEEMPIECYQYKLKGVIIHSGAAEGGHYYSYINADRDNTGQPDKWF